MSFQVDHSYSERYVNKIRRIVGPLLLVRAPMLLDCTENTDLLVFSARDLRVAARVRRPFNRNGERYADLYPSQITIRCRRESGTPTEWIKLRAGFGDLMFYGHAEDDATDRLRAWVLLDLALVRQFESSCRDDLGNVLPTCRQIRVKRSDSRWTQLELRQAPVPNGDGTWFFPIDTRWLPGKAVIADYPLGTWRYEGYAHG